MKLVPAIVALFLLASPVVSCVHKISGSQRPVSLYPPLDTIIPTHTSPIMRTRYPGRIKEFMADPIVKGDIVMLGNSLTQSGRNWSEKLGVPNARNRGIAGDNTDGVLARLNELIYKEPAAIFVMIGTNDLPTGYSPEEIAQHINKIGAILAERLPKARVYIQTIMPMKAGHRYADKLKEVNTLLRGMRGTKYVLVDTNKLMANDAGALPDELTTDGIHLTQEGYKKWAEILKKIIDEDF